MRRVPALLAIVVAIAFASGCGDDTDSASNTTSESTTSELTTPTTDTETIVDTSSTDTAASATVKVVRIKAKGGAPVGGIVRADMTKGDKVMLVITSDTADEVHVHGYDLMKDVAAGGTVRITFVAKLPGRFEVELEDAGAQLAELTVNP